MTIQLSVEVRNARLAAYEAPIGTAPLLRMYSGAMPANTAAAATGTLLVEMTLPSDWLTAPSAGGVSKSGTWQDLSANAGGTLGYYRIYNSAGTLCHDQGTITATGGGGDMEVDNTSVASGQQVTVSAFSRTEANA